MDYLWIVNGHPLVSMNFQGLGEPVGHVGGTGKHIPGEPLGLETVTPISCRNSRQVRLGKNMYHSPFHIYHFPLTSEGVQVQSGPAWVGWGGVGWRGVERIRCAGAGNIGWDPVFAAPAQGILDGIQYSLRRRNEYWMGSSIRCAGAGNI